MLSSSLRTDRHCFRLVRRDDPHIMRLRDLSPLDEELGANFRRYACQLREQLQRYYPQLLTLSPQADEPWLWSLLEAAPNAAKSKRLSEARIEKLLRAHRVRRLLAAEVVEQLRAPGFALAPGTVEAASEHALLLVPHLRLLAVLCAMLRSRTLYDPTLRHRSLPVTASEAAPHGAAPGRVRTLPQPLDKWWGVHPRATMQKHEKKRVAGGASCKLLKIKGQICTRKAEGRKKNAEGRKQKAERRGRR